MTVRFDPADKTVLLVRSDQKQAQLTHEKERLAKEEALLRGKK